MASRPNTTPLEDDEQIEFVNWLEYQRGVKFTAIPNSTFTKSWAVKRRNHALGLRAGLCDIFIVISPEASQDGLGYAIFIEMKRLQGWVVTKDQKSWIEAINRLDCLQVQAYVAKGSAEAIKIVCHYLKSPVEASVF